MAVYVVGDFLRETRLRKDIRRKKSVTESVHLHLCQELKMECKSREDLFWKNCLNGWVQKTICLILL